VVPKDEPSLNADTISSGNIIALAWLTPHGSEYDLIYVEKNSEAEHDKSVCPIVLRHNRLVNPPKQAVLYLSLSEYSSGSWGFRATDRREASPNRHIVVSTGSGTGFASRFYDSVVVPLLALFDIKQDRDYTLHTTTSASSVTNLVEEIFLPAANRGERQSIVLLSGDGGVLDIVNALVTKTRAHDYVQPAITLLPLGTGNATAHSAGLTKNNDTYGLKTWLRGTAAKPLPLFSATFSPGARYLVNQGRSTAPLATDADGRPVTYGAVVLSWALHAGLVADSDAPEFRKFGRERFTKAAEQAMFPADGSAPHVYRGKVSVIPYAHAIAESNSAADSASASGEWRPLSRLPTGSSPVEHPEPIDRHAYVLVTFNSHLEASFNVSPAAAPLDGILRIVQFGPMSGNEVMGLMTKAFQGGAHVADQRVRYLPVAAVRIEMAEDDAEDKDENGKGGKGRWRRICVDGNIVVLEKGGWVEVKPWPSAAMEGSIVDLVV
jgi:diacylglycerol kinase family enzyme